MEYSSGVILHRLNESGEREFFVCTPGGFLRTSGKIWSFPKGHIEKGETPLDAAIREFGEETSVPISTDTSKYVSYGIIQQNKYKRVYVFAKEWEGEDLSNCKSNTCFTKIKGKLIEHPEVEGYRWLTYKKLCTRGMECYLPIYKKISDNG